MRAPELLRAHRAALPGVRPPRRVRPLAAAAAAFGVLGVLGVLTFVAAGSAPARLDVVFVVDATGSMADEIEDVQASLVAIGDGLSLVKPRPVVRFGAVFYRDRGDREVLRAVPLSPDLQAVRDAILDVRADGGGDWREHVGLGLHAALEMEWARGLRLIYLVGDAPPQAYDDGYGVESAVEAARVAGVKVHVIGCSGLGGGEAEMRAIADRTGGDFSTFERPEHIQIRGPHAAHSGSSSSRGGAWDGVPVGSSLSLRSFARLGSSLSVLDSLHLGSSLALRSFALSGSSLPLNRVSPSERSGSVLDLAPELASSDTAKLDLAPANASDTGTLGRLSGGILQSILAELEGRAEL